MTIQTSITNPLRIAAVPFGTNGGLVGLTFAPGKHQTNGMTASHRRDLGIDLDVIAAWNAAAVVTLLEGHELDALSITTIGPEVRRRHMEWHHWPIGDYQVPDAVFLANWPARSAALRGLLARGGRVLVHCKGGLGRAGSVAARLLVEGGMEAAAAIAAVRAARPGAIETGPQEAWVAAGQTALPPGTDRSRPAARNRALGALLGLAVGDAVGAAIEFEPKPHFAQLDDMVGKGPHGLKPGQWTDDTAMALALADSILVDPGLDADDLVRRFLDWYDTGSYSCTGSCFDIGNQILAALERYRRGGEALAGSTDPAASGNGALMRLAPAAIRHWRNHAEMARVAVVQTRTTHGSPATLAASAAFAAMLADAIAGVDLTTILSGPAADGVEGGWRGLHRDAVEGSGYVVRSLQAALWAVSRSTDFRSAVLLAANLGDDADTTAAIAGQLAGAVFGIGNIPAAWLDVLAWRERLTEAAGQLFDAGWPETGEAAIEVPRGPILNQSLEERLQALAAFRPVFEQEGFQFAASVPGSMTNGMLVPGYYALMPEAQRFCDVVRDYGWVRPLDWSAWRETADGQRLMLDPDAVATASADDLVWILTTCVRAERFCDGYLENAFGAGLITRVVLRAESLLDLLDRDVSEGARHAKLQYHPGKGDMDVSASPENSGFAGLVATLKVHFPNFDGFEGPSIEFRQRERDYKVELSERFHETIAPLLTTPSIPLGTEIFDAVLALLTKAKPGGIVQNLVGFRTAMYLGKLTTAERVRMSELIRDLLRGPGTVIERMDRFCSACLTIRNNVDKPGSANVRSLATFLLMLDNPSENIFVRIDTFNAASLAMTGDKLIGYGAIPDGEEYQRILKFVQNIRTELTKKAWPPRDMIDLQSFIWVAGGGYNGGAAPEPKPAAPATTPPAAVPTTNMILYGPPGTGKTFATTVEAVRLCGGADLTDRPAVQARCEALVKAGQVRFVTFHQSFSYEDFIEGLRPTTSADETNGAGFRLEPTDGIFRKMALAATEALHAAGRHERSSNYDFEDRRFWKFAIGTASEANVFQGAMEGDYVALGWGGDVDWSDACFDSLEKMKKEWAEHYPEDKQPSQTQQPWLLRNEMKIGDIVIVSAGNSSFRAIAEVTGNYEFKLGDKGLFNHRRSVNWLCKPETNLPLTDIVSGNFTMRALYEIEASRINKETLNRLIKKQVPASEPVGPDQFVLIIDEINRANISKVFGELLTLLEPDKRLGASNQVTVRLPYSDTEFVMPPNLHVIGTMNTADRSIALLDTALRRRFTFREMMPRSDLLGVVDGIDLGRVLQTLNDRIEKLFDREHQIGHAYFMACKSKAEVDEVMRLKIIPLLAEYFFEDWGKVATVLGGGVGGGFLQRTVLHAPKGHDTDGEPRYRWSLRKDGFDYGELLSQ